MADTEAEARELTGQNLGILRSYDPQEGFEDGIDYV